MKFRKRHLFSNIFEIVLLSSIFTLLVSCKDKRPAPAPFDNKSSLSEEVVPESILDCTNTQCSYEIANVFFNLNGLCSTVTLNSELPPIFNSFGEIQAFKATPKPASELSCISCPPANSVVPVQSSTTFSIVGLSYYEIVDGEKGSLKNLDAIAHDQALTCDADPIPDPIIDPPPTGGLVPDACFADGESGPDLGIDPDTGIFDEIDVDNGGTTARCNHSIPLGYHDRGYDKPGGVTIYYSCVSHPDYGEARWQCGLEPIGTSIYP